MSTILQPAQTKDASSTATSRGGRYRRYTDRMNSWYDQLNGKNAASQLPSEVAYNLGKSNHGVTNILGKVSIAVTV